MFKSIIINIIIKLPSDFLYSHRDLGLYVKEITFNVNMHSCDKLTI